MSSNLCTHCRLVPAVPGIAMCYECAEDASAEIQALNRPCYTGETCVACGALLTDHDDCTTHPNHCAKCRTEAHRSYQKIFGISLGDSLLSDHTKTLTASGATR